jgi:hypothetical protein
VTQPEAPEPESVARPSKPKPTVAPSETIASAAAGAKDDAGTVERAASFGRGRANRLAWLWVALPIVGLSIVPLVGLVYAATTTFGATAEPAGSGSAGALDEDGEALLPGATKGSKTKAKSKSGSTTKTTSSRGDEADACCNKLRELGKSAEKAARTKYLGAASLCQSANDPEAAYKRVERNLKIGSLDIPEECVSKAEGATP